MNVLVLETSRVFALKLIETLRTFRAIDEVLYGSSLDKPINILYSNRFDIVICGIPLSKEDIETLNEIRKVCKPFCLIILSDDGIENYSKKHPCVSFDYLFDRTKVFRDLAQAIS